MNRCSAQDLKTRFDQVVNGGASNDHCLTANNEALSNPDFAPLLADFGKTPQPCNHNNVFSPIGLDPPDFKHYALFRDVKVPGTIVEPGETVYLSLSRWHLLTALDMSLSFSHSNIAVPNQYTHQNPKIRNW